MLLVIVMNVIVAMKVFAVRYDDLTPTALPLFIYHSGVRVLRHGRAAAMSELPVRRRDMVFSSCRSACSRWDQA